MFKTHLTLTIIALSLFLTACMGNQENNNQSDNNKIDVEQSSFQPDEIMTRSDIADHLANLAVKVSDVEDAAAIVAGPYTVVGIDIKEEIGRSRTGTIKQSVLEALKHDPYGKEAVVIADADMLERLSGMRKAIQDDAPVQGVADELANIVSRYMPTVPKNDGPRKKNKQDEKQENKEK